MHLYRIFINCHGNNKYLHLYTTNRSKKRSNISLNTVSSSSFLFTSLLNDAMEVRGGKTCIDLVLAFLLPYRRFFYMTMLTCEYRATSIALSVTALISAGVWAIEALAGAAWAML